MADKRDLEQNKVVEKPGLMKKLLGFILFFGIAGIAHADVVSVSTSAPTAIVSSGMFTSKTIALQVTSAGQIFFNSQPIVSTATFASASFSIGSSSGIIILPNFHGTIYAEAPQSAAAVNLLYLGGQ